MVNQDLRNLQLSNSEQLSQLSKGGMWLLRRSPVLAKQPHSLLQFFRALTFKPGKLKFLFWALHENLPFRFKKWVNFSYVLLNFYKYRNCYYFQVILALGDYMNVQCHACIGGTNVGEDVRKLDYGQHVVSGTPGRVFGKYLFHTSFLCPNIPGYRFHSDVNVILFTFRHDQEANTENQVYQAAYFGWSRWDVEQGIQGTDLWCVPLLTPCDPSCPPFSYTPSWNFGNDQQIYDWSYSYFGQTVIYHYILKFNRNIMLVGFFQWWIDSGRHQTIFRCRWTWRMEIWHIVRSVRYADHHASCHLLQH